MFVVVEPVKYNQNWWNQQIFNYGLNELNNSLNINRDSNITNQKYMLDKKEIKRQYKQTIQPMGIYLIKNLTTGKIFIGNTKNLNAVFNSAKLQLKTGTFMNRELQKDFIESGEGNFSFDVLDRLEPKDDLNYDYTEDLKILEELWMEKLQPYDPNGYHKKK
jgi:hypothetical protein